ncbi:MAG: dodecin domain-containing protein, partial [Stellaceae bacterium]
MPVEDGRVAHYQVTLKVGFTLDGGGDISAKEFTRRHWPPFISSRTWLLGRKAKCDRRAYDRGAAGKAVPEPECEKPPRSAASHNLLKPCPSLA